MAPAAPEVLPLGLAYLRVALLGVSTLVLNSVVNPMLRGAREAWWLTRVLILSMVTTVPPRVSGRTICGGSPFAHSRDVS